MKLIDINVTAADELGLLLAEIADLEKRADAIKASMKDKATAQGGDSVFDGAMFCAKVVEANRKVTDWKAIAKACNIPAEVIEANTSVTAVFSVKVTSK
jgi:hypothetical protein